MFSPSIKIAIKFQYIIFILAFYFYGTLNAVNIPTVYLVYKVYRAHPWPANRR